MTQQLPLLIELGTEELPPKALPELAQAFFDGVVAGLAKRGIAHDSAGAAPLYSPRRLAVALPAVAVEQPTQKSEVLGPYLNIGLKDGQPTPALTGFAAKNGVAVDALGRTTDAKGERFVARSEKPGAATASLLPEIVVEALKGLPIPKPMRWGDRDVQFVRPAHWLVLLFGDAIVPATVLGLVAGRDSRGHRFHHPSAVTIADARAATYVAALRGANVLVDPVERGARVRAEVEIAVAKIGGGLVARMDAELVDEVTCLNEWPRAIACAFDREFLAVPKEALIETMQKNQRFFPVLDAAGALTAHFVGIANIDSKDPTEIRKGYERVIRPRFADAKFFFDEDLKLPLEVHFDGLKKVTYQAKLGSIWDKSCRVAELARTIANRLGLDAAGATRAAMLSKCDLLSRMVGEFPELQGIMGRTYALAQGEPAIIAAALDEFYQPRFAGDAIAPSALGRVLAIAEKLDTLAGLFAIGQKPTGNKDPFSLRRNALGLARTLIEGRLDLDLDALFREAVAVVDASRTDAVATELYDFVVERLRGYAADRGVRPGAFEAVLALRPTSLSDFDQRLTAVVEFGKLPEAEKLAAANKRIGNILRQAGEKAIAIAPSVDASRLEAGAEAALGAAVDAAVTEVAPLLASRRYVDALRRLAALQAAVDAFFDGVMVMVDDAGVRANRLALLARLRAQFLAIADVGLLSS